MDQNEQILSVDEIKQMQTKSKFHFISKGNQFWFLMDPFQVGQEQDFTNETCFDGKHYYRYYPTSGSLIISTRPEHRNTGEMWDYTALFDPFAFLVANYRKGDGRPSAFIDATLWGNWLKSAKFESITEVNQKQCLVVACPGDGRRDRASLKVYFSISDNYYPIRIESFGSDGLLYICYTVTNIGYTALDEKLRFPFPETAVRECYRVKNSHPVWVNRSTYTSTLQIGRDISQNTFLVDPIRATKIYDTDNKVWIKVPK